MSHHECSLKKYSVRWKLSQQHRWQSRCNDMKVSTQPKRKERQPGGAPLVLFTLCLISSFGMLCSLARTHMRAHTHTHIMRKSITVQLKGQQITSCTFMMSVCVLMCTSV